MPFEMAFFQKTNQLNLEEPGDLVDMPEFVTRFEYEKSTFLSKLDEMNIKKDVIGTIMDKLDEKFTYGLLLGAN